LAIVLEKTGVVGVGREEKIVERSEATFTTSSPQTRTPVIRFALQLIISLVTGRSVLLFNRPRFPFSLLSRGGRWGSKEKQVDKRSFLLNKGIASELKTSGQ
jgi:hypothetical protein